MYINICHIYVECCLGGCLFSRHLCVCVCVCVCVSFRVTAVMSSWSENSSTRSSAETHCRNSPNRRRSSFGNSGGNIAVEKMKYT